METPHDISSDPNVLVGKPVIKGTRIPVALILNLLAHGYTVERVVEAYPVLTPEAVQAAIAYAEKMVSRERVVDSGYVGHAEASA